MEVVLDGLVKSLFSLLFTLYNCFFPLGYSFLSVVISAEKIVGP
jgi:hypothetical protein